MEKQIAVIFHIAAPFCSFGGLSVFCWYVYNAWMNQSDVSLLPLFLSGVVIVVGLVMLDYTPPQKREEQTRRN